MYDALISFAVGKRFWLGSRPSSENCTDKFMKGPVTVTVDQCVCGRGVLKLLENKLLLFSDLM
jgi:hypothetical protein